MIIKSVLKGMEYHKVLGETCINERPERQIDIFNYKYNVVINTSNVYECIFFYVCVYITDVLT